MTSPEVLNYLYDKAPEEIDIVIVEDKLMLSALKHARELYSHFQDEIDPLFKKCVQRTWKTFPEIQNNPLNARDNQYLNEILTKALDTLTEIEVVVDKSLKGIVESISNDFRNINLRQESPAQKLLFELLASEMGNAKENEKEVINSVILVKGQRLKYGIEGYLRDNHNFENVLVMQLRECTKFTINAKQAIIIGSQFELADIELVLSNLILNKLVCLTHFNYLRNQIGYFDNPLKKLNRPLNILKKSDGHYLDEIDLNETPKILLENTFEELQTTSIDESLDELVDCRVMRFQDGRFALFPNDDIAEEEEEVEVLRQDSHNRNFVEKVTVTSLEPESIVLMRDGTTSANAIVPQANLIMGDKAPYHRNHQMNWKKRLKQEISKRGVEGVRRQLRDHGIARPYVRHWSRDHLIRPKLDEHFYALLVFLEFSRMEIIEIFNSARVIRSAHQRAGNEITKTLKEAFADISLDKIYRDGTYSVTLENDSQVRVVALVFEDLSQDVVPARLSRTRRLFEERDLT